MHTFQPVAYARRRSTKRLSQNCGTPALGRGKDEKMHSRGRLCHKLARSEIVSNHASTRTAGRLRTPAAPLRTAPRQAEPGAHFVRGWLAHSVALLCLPGGSPRHASHPPTLSRRASPSGRTTYPYIIQHAPTKCVFSGIQKMEISSAWPNASWALSSGLTDARGRVASQQGLLKPQVVSSQGATTKQATPTVLGVRQGHAWSATRGKSKSPIKFGHRQTPCLESVCPV